MRLLRVLLFGIIALDFASASSISVGLFGDASTSPGGLIAPIGSLDLGSLASFPSDYRFPLAVPIPLDTDTRYWIGVSTDALGYDVFWWLSTDVSGVGVGGEYFSGQPGVVEPNSVGVAFIMRVIANSGVLFDSTGGNASGGGLNIGSLGPLYASFSTNDGQVSLSEVDLQLDNEPLKPPAPVPEPTCLTLMLCGLGSLALGLGRGKALTFHRSSFEGELRRP